MKLIDLEPKFVRYEERIEGGRTRVYHVKVDSIESAQGAQFLCPKCFEANNGRIGTHSVLCWSRSRGTPEQATPGPGRWSLHGTGFDDLTLDGDGGSRSIQLLGGCNWHGYVTNGETSNA